MVPELLNVAPSNLCCSTNGSFVALCKPVQPICFVAQVEGTDCKTMLDSGSSVSLIADVVINKFREVRHKPAELLLLTASGKRMYSLGHAQVHNSH